MLQQTSVFHKGELAIQKRLGVAEKVARYANMVVRDHMPEQHREFYQQLPMVFLGHQDNDGQVWASVLQGKPGFIASENNKALSIAATPMPGDPLQKSLQQLSATKQSELRLGMLGIELSTRRRNRLSAKVVATSGDKVELSILQTFGNCPQYIQTRELSYVALQQPTEVSEFSVFDAETSRIVSESDTFFVASSSGSNDNFTHGADVSHRGGNPGFIKIENNSLLIPDFTGNNHFNTLGNFQINPAAGLLFIDFHSGDVITMTGKAEILWDHPQQKNFKGAERFWRFKLTSGLYIRNAFPWRFKFQQYSPNTLMTGNWHAADAHHQLEQQGDNWHNFTVSALKDESSSIRSFWLSSQTVPVPQFKAGQFITVRAEIKGKFHSRNYSISSSPHDKQMRISVKKDGVFSQWLHTNIKEADQLSIRLPQGQFYLEPSERPAILLSAGVGITPMVSIFRYAIQESQRLRKPREILLINTSSKVHQQAFFEEINQLSAQSDGLAKAIWTISNAESDTTPGVHYSVDGRIDKKLLQRVLPLGRYHFYLCGPSGFMQSMYDLLIELGVRDQDIKAESFGPASLKRLKQEAPLPSKGVISSHVADAAVINFTRSRVEQSWNPEDGNLLDFAEAHGLTPAFACRSGSCGSCKVRITEGDVVHSATKTFKTTKEEVLLCCAKPRKGLNDKTVKISIEL